MINLPNNTFPNPELGADQKRQSGDPLVEMAGLMNRLLEDPESEAVLMPQLLRLSEALPDGPTRGALASSVVAMSRLRGWLLQLQSRQRLTTRFSEVTARLSRVEGLPALMQALADEARMMLDAPVARLDVFAPLVVAGGPDGVRAHSGSTMGSLNQLRLLPGKGLVTHLSRQGLPLVMADGLTEALRHEARDLDDAARAEGLHGLVVVPLLLEGACCGVLMVADRVVRQWSVMDVDALQQLASVAVRAIGRVARADMAQHTLQALHERQRVLRQQIDRETGLGALLPVEPGEGGATIPPLGTIALLLWAVPPAVRGAYVDRVIGPLRRADQARGTSLVLTLLTYMDQGHNARAAARILGVHVNTLHNRLESISALLPDWNEPGRGLEVHLALRLAE